MMELFFQIVNGWKSLLCLQILLNHTLDWVSKYFSWQHWPRHLLNHIKRFVSLFLSCIFSFVKQLKKQNEKQNVLQNETKDLTFEVSNLSITFFFKIIFFKNIWHPYINEVVLTFVTCLWIDFEKQIYCSFLRMEGGSKN